MSSRTLSRRARLTAIGVASVVVLAATAFTVWRVLRPSEVVTLAHSSYPEPPILAPGKVGVLVSAPLILDGRIRVFAKKREVWSDAPPNYHYERSAYWSYRRWPAEVTGVAAVPAPTPSTPHPTAPSATALSATALSATALSATALSATALSATALSATAPSATESLGTGLSATAPPPGEPAASAAPSSIVVTAWSDGELVGLNSRDGSVAWRAQGDTLANEYTGRRTGAETVYEPPGLYTTAATIVTVADETMRGYDFSGRQLWSRPVPVAPECRGTGFTTQNHLFILDTCTATIARVDAATGNDAAAFGEKVTAVQPVSCQTGHHQCTAMRTTSDSERGWIVTGSEPQETPILATPGALLVNGTAIVPSDPEATSEIKAVDLATDQPIWTFTPPAPAQLLAGATDRVFLLTEKRTLISLDPRTGEYLTRSGVNLPHEPEEPYKVRRIYAVDNYISLERVTFDVPESANDDSYYFTHRPVLLAVG